MKNVRKHKCWWILGKRFFQNNLRQNYGRNFSVWERKNKKDTRKVLGKARWSCKYCRALHPIVQNSTTRIWQHLSGVKINRGPAILNLHGTAEKTMVVSAKFALLGWKERRGNNGTHSGFTINGLQLNSDGGWFRQEVGPVSLPEFNFNWGGLSENEGKL